MKPPDKKIVILAIIGVLTVIGLLNRNQSGQAREVADAVAFIDSIGV